MGKQKNYGQLSLTSGNCIESDCNRMAGSTSHYCDEHRRGGYKCVVSGCTRSTPGGELHCEEHRAKGGYKFEGGTAKQWLDDKNYAPAQPRHRHAGDEIASFEFDGLPITLYGAQVENLSPTKHYRSDTLIINCLGKNLRRQNIIVGKPKRLSKGLDEFALEPEELCLDIEDREAPRLSPKFWYALRDLIVKHRYTKIIPCCFGGHGRTGTVACCLLVAFGVAGSAESAVKLVRKTYCERAVESKAQIDYINAVVKEGK